MTKKSKSSSAPAEEKTARARASRVASAPRLPRVDDAALIAALVQQLQMAALRAEKCELREATENYAAVLHEARAIGNLRITMEALAGLLRLAGEAQDEKAIRHWGTELDALMAEYPGQIPPMAWYCKGAIARHRSDARLAQKYFHRYLRAVRREDPAAQAVMTQTRDEAMARGWLMLAITLWQRNRIERARWLANEILRFYGESGIRGVCGMVYQLLGTIAEKQKKFPEALQYFQKADAHFLGEHSWYYHLYILLAYARLARLRQDYSQAYWYLDLIERAASGPEFGVLRREIHLERSRLEDDAVDLLIDSRQGIVQTREQGLVSLGKQYVLINILEALTSAHRRDGGDHERGLSKAEIIERVWKENYRPEAHDNKLYYNINRLRKLIEPDVHKPQYLLNWKEGYRLAPGLKVQFVGSSGSGDPTDLAGDSEN